ncbi:MAG: hypothetical protein IPG47_01740 [Thermoflexaceae bacterium]|nr:hypothetical protein [Thermoflexaceae bacterium]
MAAQILIVHRRAAARRFMRLGVSLMGYTAEEASSSADARALGQRAFRALVVEADLGDTDAADVIAAARDRQPGIPVLLVSAGARPPRGAEDAFLAEPFDLESLHRELARLLRNRPPQRTLPPRPAAAPVPRPGDGVHRLASS